VTPLATTPPMWGPNTSFFMAVNTAMIVAGHAVQVDVAVTGGGPNTVPVVDPRSRLVVRPVQRRERKLGLTGQA
jgi:hypothetical protein